MTLNPEEMLHLAELARLELSEEERNRVERELEAVLGYVERLQAVNTENVEPFTMPARSESWRMDEARVSNAQTRELILQNFPERREDLLLTPGVFEKPKGTK